MSNRFQMVSILKVTKETLKHQKKYGRLFLKSCKEEIKKEVTEKYNQKKWKGQHISKSP